MLHTLEQQLKQKLIRNRSVTIAFSGGVDSTALLLVCNELKKQNIISYCSAIHIDHCQPYSEKISSHCKKVCDKLDIPIAIHQIPKNTIANETNWRDARYTLISQKTPLHTQILLAHHQEDQAETFLLHAFRGNATSLKGMLEKTWLFDRLYIRPFLSEPKQNLKNYVIERKIKWLDDPSNTDNRHPRNFLRNEILPLVKSKWPESLQALDHCRSHIQQLNIANKRYNQLNFLNNWLKKHQVFLAKKELEELLDQMICAKSDANPTFEFKHQTILRFKQKLYILDTSSLEWEPFHLKRNTKKYIINQYWTIQCEVRDSKFDNSLKEKSLQIKSRNKIPASIINLNGFSKRLKKFYQDNEIMPIIRDYYPLLFEGNSLVGIIHYKKPTTIDTIKGINLSLEPSYPIMSDLLPQMDLDCLADLQ